MTKRQRMYRWTVITVVAIAVVASAGLVYAGRSSHRRGGSHRGHPHMFWVDRWCDQTRHGSDDLTATPPGFDAPEDWRRVGRSRSFEVWRTSNDVAHTDVDVSRDGHSVAIEVTIENAYPSHYERCGLSIFNYGWLPIWAPYVVIEPLNGDTSFASEMFADDGTVWVGFDKVFTKKWVHSGKHHRGSFQVHVEQAAEADTIYRFRVSLCVLSWHGHWQGYDSCDLYNDEDVHDGTVVVIPSPAFSP